jgi:hypothetical protein
MTDHGAKPDGLWFSAGDGPDGWKAFAERRNHEGDQRFSRAQLTHQTQIIFSTSARRLNISSAEEIDAFTCEYGNLSEGTTRLTRGLFRRSPAIDWPRIANDFDAVVIAQFCRERANHAGSAWYNCWDAASGCVWNPDMVTLKPLTY